MATLVQRIPRPPDGTAPGIAGAASPPPELVVRRLQRFTVQQFLKMVDERIFPDYQHLELLDGLVVHKMTQNPPHSVACQLARRFLARIIPEGLHIRDQKPIALPRSLPEPDLAVVEGDEQRYAARHPRPPDIALLIEVADTSLAEDRDFKGPLYARSRIPSYWIINLPESSIEVYTEPRAGKLPHYQHRHDYSANEAVPVVIEGHVIGQLAVGDLLPRKTFP
jgi:Putative restriction endonuclease